MSASKVSMQKWFNQPKDNLRNTVMRW